MRRSAPALLRWRDQSRARRLALLGILLASAVLFGLNLGRGGDFDFYATAARSMSENWRALFFGAYDPAATVTLDKLSGFLVPQAASAAIFGFSTASIVLPQVLEGVATVWFCALAGLRWRGPLAGLVAAGAAATTPILVSTFGHPMEDGLLTASLAAAVVCWQSATLGGRRGMVVLAALCVGVGFQAKMMQAWLILPALAIGLLLAPGLGRGGLPTGALRMRRRVARLVGFGALAAVFSLSWMTAIQLVPAGERPWVDGSTNDNEFSMVFGYNGVDRFLPGAVPGAVGSGGRATHHGAGRAAAVGVVRAPVATPQDSRAKLVLPIYLTQIGWLYPVGLAGIALAAWRILVRRRGAVAPDAARGGRADAATLAALAVWLATSALVLSAVRMPHTAYLAALAVPLALLGGSAVADAVRLTVVARRAGIVSAGRGEPPAGTAALPAIAGLSVLPALAVLCALWACVVAAMSGVPLGFGLLLGGVPAVAAVSSVVLASRGRPVGRGGRRLLGAALVVAVLAAPALWSAQALDPNLDGTGGDAYVGVRPASGFVRFGGGATGAAGTAARDSSAANPVVRPVSSGGSSDVGDVGFGPHLDSAPRVPAGVTALLTFLDAHRASGSALFATDSWSVSSPVILSTAEEVLTTGGYSGQAEVFSEAQLAKRVAEGKLRWVVVRAEPDGQAPWGAAASDPVRDLIAAGGCRAVPSWRVGDPTVETTRGEIALRVYDCGS